MKEADAITLLDEFRTLLDESQKIYDGDFSEYYKHPKWPVLQENINTYLPAVRKIAERVESALLERLVSHPGQFHWEWDQVRDATYQLRGAIELRERVDSILEPAGPKIAAAALHRWVWDAAVELWADGHRRAAVQTAGSAIEAQLQAKLGRTDLTGADLVTQAFTLTGVGTRLRFSDLPPDSSAYRSAHEGAMFFGRGCMQGIRNLASHTTDELDEQVALEQLAALSVLARWIDGAAPIEQSE